MSARRGLILSGGAAVLGWAVILLAALVSENSKLTVFCLLLLEKLGKQCSVVTHSDTHT